MASTKLSTNVLQMKFMERSRTKVESQQMELVRTKLKKAYLAQPNKEVNANSAGTGQVISECKKSRSIVYEYRFEILRDLLFGRLSFRGFNPEIEKLMQYYHEKQFASTNLNESVDIQDEEMATVLGAHKTIRRKFASKKNTVQDEQTEQDQDASKPRLKKRQFMKPLC